MKGTVKRFYFRKGFGFIEGDQGTEYFFHYTDFTGDKEGLRPGLEVEFEAQQGDKGPCAVAVVLPGGKPAPARAPRQPAAARPTERQARGGAGSALLFALGLVVGMVIGFTGHWLLTQ
ncbi:MAG TPA: cold shock domain-containing protein [Immundisolibacter sp.]